MALCWLCECRQSGAAGTDLVEPGAASSSLSFSGGGTSPSDSCNVLGLLQRDSSRYPELYSSMLQHQPLTGQTAALWHHGISTLSLDEFATPRCSLYTLSFKQKRILSLISRQSCLKTLNFLAKPFVHYHCSIFICCIDEVTREGKASGSENLYKPILSISCGTYGRCLGYSL